MDYIDPILLDFLFNYLSRIQGIKKIGNGWASDFAYGRRLYPDNWNRKLLVEFFAPGEIRCNNDLIL